MESKLMVVRDRRRNIHYFEELIAEFESEMQLTQDGLDNGDFTSPTERVDVAQQLFQLAIMRAITHYSYGTSIDELAPYVLAILPYRQQLTRRLDKLPPPHQFYRIDFELLGGADEACGSSNINRYVYALWWLSLLVACKASSDHIQSALAEIGEQGKDALLDNIAIRLGDANRAVSNSLYYPDIYQPLLDAFSVDTLEPPALLSQFVNQWYSSLTEADWYDNHDCDCEFEYTDYYIGYWSFEHALVANLLDVRDIPAHPMIAADLVPAYNGNYYPDAKTLTRHELSVFTLENNPTAKFRQKWQDNYFDSAMNLWEQVRGCFKNHDQCHFTRDELLFCLNYDFAVAPHKEQPVDRLIFYKWIISNLNNLG
jgi:hypothetical protein